MHRLATRRSVSAVLRCSGSPRATVAATSSLVNASPDKPRNVERNNNSRCYSVLSKGSEYSRPFLGRQYCSTTAAEASVEKHEYQAEKSQSARIDCISPFNGNSSSSAVSFWRRPGLCNPQINSVAPSLFSRFMATMGESLQSASQDTKGLPPDAPPRLKFKRLDKTARHIMQIIDKESVEQVKGQREIPDIRPGYIVQLKVVVPENKRRVSIVKGIVIARRNAGLNTTFRLRRLVAGVGVESLFPLYSPNLKEIKVLDKKKVRRAKLYYLRDKMNALKKQ